jgi:uncharacterized protein DUF4386
MVSAVIAGRKGGSMSSMRRTSLWAGIWFAMTFVTSIVAAILYGGFGHVLKDTQFILGGSDARIQTGAFLELLLLVSNIASAVVLFPVLKWQWEAGALGYVTARVMESAFIMVGILCLLAVLTIQPASGGTARTLIAVHDWTFDLGPGFVVGIGNGLLLGYMMFRSGLVPRGLAMFGLIGGPLLLITGTLVVFGIIEPNSAVKSVATIPEIIWEAGLTLYLLFKGFRESPVLDLTELERNRLLKEQNPMVASSPVDYRR